MYSDTIVPASADYEKAMRALVIDQPEPAAWRDGAPGRQFRIRAADTDGHRSSARILVNRMYAWRGYHHTVLPAHGSDNRLTLVAEEHDETVGTMTVGFDGPEGLLVEEVFAGEVAALRALGHRVCEFTKLAMDRVVRSKRVLASLFHVAYIYAHLLNKYDRLLIEVNPRHVRYYEKMLGFEVLSGERMNLRVNAPAVLLCLDLSHAYDQIGRFGGLGDTAESERSLYPHFFSSHEEAGILARIRASAVPRLV
jgi:hypothetical protein